MGSTFKEMRVVAVMVFKRAANYTTLVVSQACNMNCWSCDYTFVTCSNIQIPKAAFVVPSLMCKFICIDAKNGLAVVEIHRGRSRSPNLS